MNKFDLIRNGITKENPILVQLVGMCATLAITTSLINGIGMGVAVTAVLTGSNIVISLIRKYIPDEVRIPAFIIVIAAFTTAIDILMHAYTFQLYKALGVFIPLIVVNCLILARAEAFASKNSLSDSLFDGIGMGVGFLLAMSLLSAVREILGNGTILGIRILPEAYEPVMMAIQPPGAFILLGLLLATVNLLSKRKKA
jgi:electron transport complex protein RnfE